MSICKIGLKSKVKGGKISILIPLDHKLITLANIISWERLSELVLPDLKNSTTKLKWWLGRPLKLRIHLGVYILQQLYNYVDRTTETAIQENAAYQIFCGKFIVKNWHCPDHTKIEEFRSRLKPKTQQAIANEIAVLAVNLGFANPSKLDIDSTIQEANMAYPSDVNLMIKLGSMAKRVANYLNKTISCFQLDPIEVDFKGIKTIARKYFFKKQGENKKEKHNILTDLWAHTHSQVKNLTKVMKVLLDYDWKHMPWNIKRAAETIEKYATQYFLDVMNFIIHKKICKEKRLSFHLFEVSCFNKGKPDKKLQFGRAYQLARLPGNFFIIQKNQDVRMADKENFSKMINTHLQLFGEDTLESVAADKGYYSKKNENDLIKQGIVKYGLQKPGVKRDLSANEQLVETELINRRAGIEPLIGHIKHRFPQALNRHSLP